MNNFRCGAPMQQMQNRPNCGQNDGGSTGSFAALPADPVVAMAYVPFQESSEVYAVNSALLHGTAFPVLNKPFLAGCLQ